MDILEGVNQIPTPQSFPNPLHFFSFALLKIGYIFEGELACLFDLFDVTNRKLRGNGKPFFGLFFRGL